MSLPPHPRRAEAQTLLRAGTPRAEVARRTGASLRAVQAWARRLGIPPEGRGAGVVATQIAGEVLERIALGQSTAQIAGELEITPARVRQIRAEHPVIDGSRK